MPILESAADAKYQHQLPTVSFRVVEDDQSMSVPAGVHSEQSRSYGYNDFSDFERPEYYIRYIEPIESELKIQVEYDMDEQDQAWLDVINTERKKDQSGPVSYEVFEIVMDKLEKEWFELVKRIPQPVSHLPVEDSKCAICDDPEGENSNAIVFCDGCNLAVHQDCYGVPYIPEGQWLCRKCTVSPENPVSCLFCPNEGGAFKQTSTGHWAHLLCAMWIPEVTVGNAIYMEPVDGVESVPRSRWKLNCAVCRERVGACIQCDNKNCFTAFHVTCARQMGFLTSMKTTESDGQLRAFCEKHIPSESRSEMDDDDTASNYSGTPIAPSRKARGRPAARQSGPVTSKSARAHTKAYRPGPPVVPHMIVQHLLDYVAKIAIRKRQPFVERLCRYWSLKREARRGAPLLKRLHLEPWTASSASKQQSDAEKAMKLKFLTLLRNDLEKVRMLAELVRKREREKLRQTQLLNDIVDQYIFPYYGKLRLTLEKISAMDRQELFLHPVNKAEVPDYFEVVKQPMCWLFIDDKIEKNSYQNLEEFKHDINLVLDNAILYNAPETPFTRVAKRIKANAKPLLDELDGIPQRSRLRPSPYDEVELPEEGQEKIGDLEPSLVLLNALTTISDGESVDHLQSLFSFRLEPPRPPTPPPAPPKVRKALTASERKAKWDEREAKARERMASGSTRAARALEDAFVHDAGLPGSSSEEPSSRSTRAQASSSKALPKADSKPVVPAAERHRKGVAQYETYHVLSDKERRAQEMTLDIMTEEVGSQDTFKRFNIGWVLPEGSKRHRAGRPPTPPRPVKPAPKPKEEKVEPRFSPAETPAPSGSSLTPPPTGSIFDSEATPQRPASPSRKGKRKDPGGNNTLRAGKRSKKAPSDDDTDMADTDLTEAISNDEDDEKEEAPPATTIKPPSGRSRPRRSVAKPTLPDKPKGKSTKAIEAEDPYPPNTLVWAKLTSFPYFPAEIIDVTNDDPSEIPPSVFQNRTQAEKENGAQGQRTWLVRFFDSQNSYGWIPAKKLDLLGENNDIDEMYLSGREKGGNKRFKSQHLKAACRKAYRAALAQMEIEPDDES